MKYTVAAAQINSGPDKEENLQKITSMMQEAAAHHADIIVFPETVEYIGPDLPGNASPVPGPITEFFSALAKKYQIYLHCGSITEKMPQGNPRNTSLFFGRDGSLIGTYSKLHMFDISMADGPSYKESDEICPGDKISVFNTDLGHFGAAICYDIRFPELFRLMAKAGAEVIFVPANFTMNTGKDHWKVLLQARAIENTCYIVAADQIGQKPSFNAYGKSMIIDPWGNVISMASDREQLIYAEIDTDYIADIRSQMPSLSNTRDDIYHLNHIVQ